MIAKTCLLFVLALSALGLFPGPAYADTPYDCPATMPFSDGRPRPPYPVVALMGAALFDTAPENKISIPPVPFGVLEHWDLAGTDPYLVCMYSNTPDTAIFHAVSARVCDAGGTVYKAGCR